MFMTELRRCVYCNKPIKPDDDFVEVPPAAQDSRSFGEPIYQQYAHVKCDEGMAALETDLSTPR